MMSEENNDGSDWHSQVLKDYSSICVDDEYINSLTFQEPPNENFPHVSNIDESVPFEGQIFSNDGDAYEFYSLFARKNGFSISLKRTHSVFIKGNLFVIVVVVLNNATLTKWNVKENENLQNLIVVQRC